ncbi:DNA replication protein [Candidatus Methanoperedens nitroreducens]|uniref:DNA replication protein n=1 Tax=Candidatus Methanoperedens nitratireducens TaxID=1392998 RepID=A0A062V7C3_9EURY|nr:ATP-binding protein [Candidatus Methanoperedens nitroreducens]KCZ71295.1 DNA replication protein [Candidatus Methanoperedens nitroreducens]MDJ1420277.1 ATP-binding protein [Candidatus Methanoperedens sp.]
MLKLKAVIKIREQEKSGEVPASTSCKHCKKPVEPKLVPIIGWRKQEYCKECLTTILTEKEKEAQRKLREEKIARLIKGSGIRGIMHHMTFKSFEQRYRGVAYSTAKKYAEEFGPGTKYGFMFYGRAGSGKTHLAVAIARYIIEEKQILVRFVRIVDLLLDIRSTFNENESWRAESESELLRKYALTPLLILDDIGSEKTTDWVRQVLYQIIDERWIEQKPVIVTSNLTLEELEERLGERIASRIAGMAQLIQMQGHDYRIKNNPNYSKNRDIQDWKA